MAYCTAQDIRDVLGQSKTDNDGWLTMLADVATEHVEQVTGRIFIAETATKKFSGRDSDTLIVPDCLSVTSITLNGGVLDTTAYELSPLNRTPKNYIYRQPGESWEGETLANVQVEGEWGYSATPPKTVVVATALIAANIYQAGRGSIALTPKGDKLDRSKENAKLELAYALLEPFRRIGESGE